MKMIYPTLLWKVRSPDKINKSVCTLRIVWFIYSKGRTSSLILQSLCYRIGSIQLTLLHAHVGSMENPTDAASRR